jgi:hypothetical protein
MNDCLCFNKLGDLNQARGAKNEALKCGNASSEEEKGRKGRGKEQDVKAFKEKENVVCADDACKDFCKCGCQNTFKMPCGDMELKGGFNCEKTIRILLCDAVCVGVMALGTMGIAKGLWRKLK